MPVLIEFLHGQLLDVTQIEFIGSLLDDGQSGDCYRVYTQSGRKYEVYEENPRDGYKGLVLERYKLVRAWRVLAESDIQSQVKIEVETAKIPAV